MPHQFDDIHDPLAERLSDEELHEVSERLGEAQFGGDERVTVGAVVEATGTDASTVLRLLGEIRHRALEAQRAAVETLERRVARLEARPTEYVRPSPVVEFHPETKSDDRQRTAAGFALAIIVMLAILGLGLAAQSSHRESSYGGSTWAVSTGDGMVEIDPSGRTWVKRSDGSMREPTEDEKTAAIFARGALETSR